MQNPLETPKIIMVVDDDRFSRVLARDLLIKEGHIVHEAKDGQESVEQFAGYDPDLILMDVEMPKMNGFQACKLIKEHPEGKDIPVIFVTARDDADFISKAFASGAEDYLLKPVNLTLLRHRITQVLSNHAYKHKVLRQNQALAQALQKLKDTQGHLIQQEKMAGIGQLAAGVAHEINNPLGFINSNFETLNEYVTRLSDVLQLYRKLPQLLKDAGLSSPELQNSLDEISDLERKKKLDFILEDLASLFSESRDGLERVAKIIRALRAFSRIDVKNQLEDYDLNEGLETTLIVARNEIKYVAEIKTEFGNVPPIKALGSQINQVLLNLIVNAAQAIKSSGISDGVITLATFTSAEAVGCRITNNGPPIPPEVQKRIMEPFFTTKPVGQGTGLGLSISYDIIVKKHGGELSFISDEKNGTTFTLKLPRESKLNSENQ